MFHFPPTHYFGLSLKNKFAKRRLWRRGTTCQRDRRGNLKHGQVLPRFFYCPVKKRLINIFYNSKGCARHVYLLKGFYNGK